MDDKNYDNQVTFLQNQINLLSRKIEQLELAITKLEHENDFANRSFDDIDDTNLSEFSSDDLLIEDAETSLLNHLLNKHKNSSELSKMFPHVSLTVDLSKNKNK